MPSLVAVTRGVSEGFGRCELTHLPRVPIDVERARAQHEAYERALAALGCHVQRLPAPADMPDAVFIEDTAIVLDELAVIARPGAPSRWPETAAVAEAIAAWRPLRHIVAPATLDGGDVLLVERTLYVGRSSRTNEAGLEQLEAIVAPAGYAVRGIAVKGCLHLKSAVTRVAPRTVLLNPLWVDGAAFAGCECLSVHPDEPFGANALPVGPGVIYAAAFPRTRARLEQRGLDIRTVEVSELAKAEGAITCCSLVLATA
jgi:dimethylargininase